MDINETYEPAFGVISAMEMAFHKMRPPSTRSILVKRPDPQTFGPLQFVRG